MNLFVDKKLEKETFIIGELNYYFRKMTNCSKVKIIGNKEDADISLVIQQDLSEFGLPAVDDTYLDDQYVIDITNGRGIIYGGNIRSILLAIYRLLTECGCYFLRPGKKYEVIPLIELNKITIRLAEQASLRHRGVCIEGADSVENIVDFIEWLPKIGFNSFFVQFENPYPFLKRWYGHEFNNNLHKEAFSTHISDSYSDIIDNAMAVRHLLHHRVGHGWTSEVLGFSSKYGWTLGGDLTDETREYAALVNGKRELFDNGAIFTSICMSNKKAIDKMVNMIVNYSEEHQNIDILHVWLSDARNNICECENCLEISPTDQYVSLLNEIDTALSQKGLNTKICFLLYHELLWPPIKNQINNPERFIMMFAPITRTFEKSYKEHGNLIPSHPYVRNNMILPNSLEELLIYLKEWQAKVPSDGFVYDYPLGRAHYGDLGYMKISKIISKDISYLKDLNLNGYISCQELRVGNPTNFPNYLMGKLLWNTELNYEQIEKEYFKAMYGTRYQKVIKYLKSISILSNCDYFNAIGERFNPELACKFSKIVDLCNDMLPILRKEATSNVGLVSRMWEELIYHNTYCELLAKALSSLASGKENANDLYNEFITFIQLNETEFQNILDVYRIIEVSKNYTGFIFTNE
ncbi:DUF4838 domain-containing protein [Clostridium botulinum]|nr:DUF4838 domain-containing protein [Clostridium botulinum]KEI02365.1 hypothetical protein Y848_07770 [Clostridium botulinum C/D str. Sp77]KLU76678.1 KCNMB2, ball and chain domain protein [Clostridium botulinum V891]KOA74111.1 KCNMB2, ball and chain domain protein [Clostridium botulinum]KOA77289.1 KCNMB2, ball and chain domain protein [Clostridium botulinum]KOA83321.1 KCNMB2, ball and chain domain protein [Clostridium botulinum]